MTDWCNCGNANCSVCGVKISELSPLGSISDSNIIAIVTGSGGNTATYYVTVGQLKTYFGFTVDNPDIANFADGTIPKVVGGQFVESALVEEVAQIVSSLDISVPETSLKLEDSVLIHNTGAALAIGTALGEFAEPQYLIDATGSSKPKWYNLGSESLTNLQTTDTSTLSGTSISFVIPLSGSNQAWKINHMRLKGVSAVSGVRLVVSYNAVPNVDRTNVVFSYPQADQWEDGSGYSFSVGDFTIDTDPLILDSDNTYYVTFEVPVGSGDVIELKGDGAGVPFLQVDAQTGDIEDLIVSSDLGTYVVGPASAVNSNIVQYDGTTGRLIKDGGFSINDVKGVNIVHVNSAADLPAPSGGFITLASSTVYLIHGNISVATTIKFGNNAALVGEDRFADFVTYTGSGNMFEYSGSGSSYMAELGFTCSTGTVFAGTGTNSETLVFTNCYVIDCVKVGQLADMRNIVFRSFSVTAATDLTNGGLIVSGSTEEFNMDNSLWANVANGTMIDFQGTAFERIILPAGNRFEVDAGVVGIKAITASGNFTATARGILSHNIFAGAGTYTQNITNQDLQWEKTANAGIEDTTKNSQSYKHAVTVTTIGVGDGDSGNPKLLNGGTNFVSAHSDQFTNSNSGRITYIGKDRSEFHVRAVSSGTASAGTNKTFNIYLAKNGTVIVASKAKQTYDAGSNLGVTTAAIVDMQTNDYLEIFVENITDTTDWSSDTVNFIVSQA